MLASLTAAELTTINADLPILLSLSSNGYYDWLNRPEQPTKRAEQSSVIDEAIRIAFEDRKHRYGSTRDACSFLLTSLA